MKLFGYWRSSASWRVRTALALKGLEYEYVAVHLLQDGGQHLKDEHRARNPMGQVPALELQVGGQTRFLSQSLAICEYLDSVHPEPRLVPTDPWKAAKVRQLSEIVNAGIQPLQNLRVMLRLAGLHANFDKKAWCREWIANGFDALERELQQTAGRFCVGDDVTLADVCLVPQVFNARRFELPLVDYPTLERIDAALAGLPAFMNSHPDRQPDARPS